MRKGRIPFCNPRASRPQGAKALSERPDSRVCVELAALPVGPAWALLLQSSAIAAGRTDNVIQGGDEVEPPGAFDQLALAAPCRERCRTLAHWARSA